MTTQKKQTPELCALQKNWHKLPLWQRKRLRLKFALAVWRITLPALPPPLGFSFSAALLGFLILSQMPPHPVSIPAAFGGGLSFALILK